MQHTAPVNNSNSNLLRIINANSRYDTQRLNLGPISVTPPIKYGTEKTATQFAGLHIVN